MDNNTSAYDLSAYEKVKQDNHQNELKVIRSKANKKENALLTFKSIAIGAFVIAVVAMSIYSNAIINELGNQILSANRDYAKLVGDNKKMTAVLESKVSLKNVEEYAKENLGLAQMEQYQIEYINLLPNDKIECIRYTKEENISDKIFNRISKFFSNDDEAVEAIEETNN